MDSLFPDEIFLEIFQYLSVPDLFRGFYKLNSRLDKIINEKPINIGFCLNAEQQKYILPNVNPQQIRSFYVPEEKYEYSKLKQCSNIRQLQFVSHSKLNEHYLHRHRQLADVQPETFPYLTKLVISHQDGTSEYENLCSMIFGGRFPNLKHVDLPYANGRYAFGIRNWSTKLTYVRIGCCNKSMLYPLLENLPNLEIFHCGEIGTPRGGGPLKTRPLALKELHLATYDTLQPRGTARSMMGPGEMAELVEHLPNLVHVSLRVIDFGNLEDALRHLNNVLSRSQNLKTFDIHITYHKPRSFEPSIDVIKKNYSVLRYGSGYVWRDSGYSVCELKQDARSKITAELRETKVNADSWPELTNVQTVCQQLNSLCNRLTVDIATELCGHWPFWKFYESNIIYESNVMKAYLEILIGIVRLKPHDTYFWNLFPKGCGGCAVFQFFSIVALHPSLDTKVRELMKILLHDERERLLSIIPDMRKLAQMVRQDYRRKEDPFPYAACCLDLTKTGQGSIIIAGLGAMVQNKEFLGLMANHDEKAISVAKKMFYENKTDFFFDSQLNDFLREQ